MNTIIRQPIFNYCLLSVVYCLSFLLPEQASASHMTGADISYEYVPGSGNLDFIVRVAFYRDCFGNPAPGSVSVNIRSASCAQNFFVVLPFVSSQEIIPYCGGSLPTRCGNPADTDESREQYLYEDTVTLPALCTDWIMSYTNCCRNVAITTITLPDIRSLYVQATLNNTLFPVSSSPFFSNPPAPFVYDGQPYCYNNAAVDPDGDSLVYSLTTPRLTSNTTFVTYIFPFTATQPLTSVPPMTLNTATGDVCMTPTTAGQVTVMALLVEEYRFGTLIGSTMRDIQVNVISGADLLPTTSGINGTGIYSDTIAEGCPYTFTVPTADADAAQCLTLTSNVFPDPADAIPGATFTVPVVVCPTRPTGTFNWTPNASDVSNTPHVFVTRLRDNACTVNGEEYKAWALTVIKFSAVFTSSAPACVNQPVNFYSQYSYSSDYSYSWTFGSGSVATFTMSISQNPQGVTYTTPGAKTVVLTITNLSSGCTTSEPLVITINPSPLASFTSTAPQCAGTAVDFTNTGSTGAGTTYFWDFGAGAFPVTTSTAENPSGIYYFTAGTKTVTHTVTNNFGCVTTATSTITINPAPVASFSSSAPACMGDSVDFLNTGTTGATYAWNFGNGATPATSIVFSPQNVVYSTAGIKTVQLITTLGTCTDTGTQTININQTPAPAFTSTAPQCTGNAVTFNYTGTTGTGWIYSWDFGTGASPATSSAQNPGSVLYSTAGTKTITLTANNNGLCAQTITGTITINPTPVASFSSTAPSCTGLPVIFTNTGDTIGVTYAWAFGSGANPATSTSQDTTVVYSTAGPKTVTLISTIGTCTDTSTQIITINQTPAPSFTSNAPQCVGTSINFTYTGTTGTGWNYSWDFGTDATPALSSAQNPPSVLYSTSGTKTITLTVDNNGSCASTYTATITISATPVASFTSTAPKCTGANVDFTNTGTVVGVTWAWNFGSGATPPTSAVQSPTGITYSTSGTKVVTLTTTNLTTNCTSTYTATININLTPTVSFVSTAPQCQGSILNFTNTGSTGLGWTYSWTFGSGAVPQTSTAENPTGIVYQTAGTKTVTLTISDANCSATTTQIITINQTPVASFTSTTPQCTGLPVIFTNTGDTIGVTYAWTFGSGANPATSTSQDTTVIYSTAGPKTVTLISTIGTCMDTSTQVITINQTPNVSFSSTAPQCSGSPVNFTNTGSTGSNWSYSWNFGQGAMPATSSAENPAGIIYSAGGNIIVTFTISDQNCTNTFIDSIVINQAPVADAGKDTVICNNVSVQIGSAPIAGNTYSWFPTNTLSNAAIANPVASPIAPSTIYIVTVTNANGCTATDSAVVTMLFPLISNAGTDGEICRYDSVQIGAGLITGQNYVWTPSAGLSSATSPNPMASPAMTTTYTLSVTGPGCGPVTDEVTVIVHPLPVVDAGPNDTITIGSSTQLTATGGIQYTWLQTFALSNAGIYNPIASPSITTTYTVTVTDVFGCVNKDSVTVFVIDASFWLPSAFTPNGDMQNDILYAHGEGISNFELGVYNRWGELIWSTKDIKMGWDGKRQIGGQELPEGAYVYYVKGTLSTNKVIDASGLVNLIR